MQNAAGESRSLHGVRAGVHVSTLGLGVFAAWDAWDTFAIRGLVNYFDYDLEDESYDDEANEVNLQLQSFGLVLDWHAFRNGFRVSGGAFVNGNELSSVDKGRDLDIGDGLYDGVLDTHTDFSSIAPYLGLGWSSGHGRSGLSVGIEVGVLFQGAPRLTFDGKVTSAETDCDFSISRDGKATVCAELLSGGLKEDLEAEHRDLSDSLELYPVVFLGMSYRF